MNRETFHIEADYQALLAEQGLDRFAAWVERARGRDAHHVSRHVDRVTFPLSLPDARGGEPIRLFAKLQFSTTFKRIGMDLLAGRPTRSAARVERGWLDRLSAAGLDAMEPVAWGERRAFALPTSGLLVVRAVPAECDLAQLLVDQPALLDERPLWSAIGRLAGRLHHERIHWPDLTAKHLFPARDGAGWRVWMIDVERMQSTHRTDLLRRSLAALVDSLPRRPTAGALAAMIEAMHAASPSAGAEVDRLIARRVARQQWRWSAAEQGDAWLARPPGLLRRGGGFVNADWQDALRAAGLEGLDALFAFESGQSLHKPGLPPSRRRDRIELDDGRVIFLKRYAPTPRQRLARLFRYRARASEAADEWHALWRLANAGLPVPEPVLLDQDHARRPARRSCIALAELPHATSLEKWLPAHAGELSPARRETLLDGLADFVAYFHSLGLVHRDLYVCHIFMRTDTGVHSGEPRFALIDLARVFRPSPWRRRRWQVKDLAQLRYSLSDVLDDDRWRRWLDRYAGGQAGRGLVEGVARKVRRIARHADSRARRLNRPGQGA